MSVLDPNAARLISQPHVQEAIDALQQSLISNSNQMHRHLFGISMVLLSLDEQEWHCYFRAEREEVIDSLTRLEDVVYSCRPVQ